MSTFISLLDLLPRLLLLAFLLPGSFGVPAGTAAESQPRSLSQFPLTNSTSPSSPIVLLNDKTWRNVIVGTGGNRKSAEEWQSYLYVERERTQDGKESFAVKHKVVADWKKVKPAFLEADHLLESQVMVEFLKRAGYEDLTKEWTTAWIGAVQGAMNSKENSRLIPLELNQLKGGIFTDILAPFVNHDGTLPKAACKFPIQRWRRSATVSVFKYLASTCKSSIGTARTIQAYFEVNGPPPQKYAEEWWKVETKFKELLFDCLPLKATVVDAFGAVEKCALDQTRFIDVED